MKKTLRIRDLTLRDGQQSLFATRMNQKQVDRVLPLFRDAHFYAMEVWGGAVPDAIMRFLKEDPWNRLESIKTMMGDASLLTALSRGRNLFGYSPYPEKVIEGFNRNAVQSGIGIMRIFDALNDTNNIRSTIGYVKASGGVADCCICYTVDPKFTMKERARAFWQMKKLPRKIFRTSYFIEKARELESMGADMITVKDMAGLVPPAKAAKLISGLKAEVGVPIDFHTHCTPGYGLASALVAIINGVDIIDTAILNFSGGPAAPSFEIIQIFCNKLGIDTGVNPAVVGKINRELAEIRKEHAELDAYPMPRPWDLTTDTLPAEIDQLFDQAIEYATQMDQEKLLEATQAIEKWFGLPEPDEAVKNAEIPGGMYTNMLAQIKQLKLDHLLTRVLEVVPVVRVSAGCPPLVTPTSQIIGVQAVNYVLDENKGNKPYTTNNNQFISLVKGEYGATPIEIDPDFRELICGVREETPYNMSKYTPQPNPALENADGRKLAENEKEELLLELFPQVAEQFLRETKEQEFRDQQHAEEMRKIEIHLKEKAAFDSLPAEEKKKRLIEGLYNYNWSSGL
ncbi:MAG TPA: carboxylase [Bacteroidales bacterium]|nr:carboxylase [Bacteroidales bacterium]HRZ48024.1 carboxylase [Bacteroidales bacterium]